jgi:hypothetical protein
MNALAELREAVGGWLDLLSRRPEGPARFNPTREGAVNATGFYVAMILLTVLVAALTSRAEGYSQMFFTFAVNALPLVAIALVIVGTLTALRLDVRFNTLFVPATYALSFILLLGIPVSMSGSGMLSNVLLGILGYMLYRLARAAGKMNIGVSIAFAALSIVVLVAMPIGLYMLTVPAPPAA